MSRLKNSSDFTKYLSQALTESPLWKALYEKTQVVIASVIEERINQLEHLRIPEHIKRGDYIEYQGERLKVSQIERDQEAKTDKIYAIRNDSIIEIPLRALHTRDILINGSAVSGFNYFSDSLSDDDYARIYQFINDYWPRSGDNSFIKFIGFIKGLNLDIYQLWDTVDSYDTKDTYNILERKYNQNPFFEEGGNAYPSSHVEVEYDYFRNLDLDIFDLISLFYYMAPIHLVLHRISQGAFVTPIFTSKPTGYIASSLYSSYSQQYSYDYRLMKTGYVEIYTYSKISSS